MKTVFAAILILVGTLTQAQAKTLVISDIDDTLKISHVLNRVDSFDNAMRTDNVFAGMNVVLDAVSVQDPDTKFYYVTNAPRSIMETPHGIFLQANRFPGGLLRLREGFFQTDFKVTEIRRIIQAQQPDTILFFGDNGEKDPEVYYQIRNEFPGIRYMTFIRQGYFAGSAEKGAELKPDQIGFVTSWDLMLHLRGAGFVSDQASRIFLTSFAQVYANEPADLAVGTVAVPAWVDCRDFNWTAPDNDFLGNGEHALVKGKVLSRCAK